MALPPDAVAQVARYCESRVSDDVRVEPLLAAIDEDATGIFWG